MRAFASLVALPLAACAAVTLPADGNPPAHDIKGTCQREPGQRFIGQKATGELGRTMLAATGATILRWVPPRTAVTMDFNPSRLTVSYDDDYAITRVSCT
ncbi:MAG TPA: I78 family peptidase inhibitor [Croceibacterium sp.]|nr:I78 family peptidase inhibitor [Croceibacterium sp.]